MVPDTDVLSPELQRLLQLFWSLPDVRFPELDASSLQDAVARLKERHLELSQLEAQAQALRAALDDEHEALLRKSHRLLAYLKVFAETDAQLAEKVGVVTLPRLRRSAAEGPSAVVPEAPRKRGRPRKAAATDALFVDASASAAQ